MVEPISKFATGFAVGAGTYAGKEAASKLDEATKGEVCRIGAEGDEWTCREERFPSWKTRM